jgi:hypothetical protein
VPEPQIRETSLIELQETPRQAHRVEPIYAEKEVKNSGVERPHLFEDHYIEPVMIF